MPSIVFISSFLSPQRLISIKENSKGPISNANSNFQLSILDGFIQNSSSFQDFIDVNLPNIGAYPFRYRKPYYRGENCNYRTLDVIDCGFLNLPHIKHFFKRRVVYRILSRYIKKQLVPPIIIIYDLDKSILSAINKLKEIGCKFLAILIIPDLPGMTGNVDHWAYRLFKRKNNVLPDLSCVDGYVVLSEYMRYPLNIVDKPFMIMEGIYSVNQETINEDSECKILTPYILYTGALDERNGIYNLLEAFKKIPNKDLSLVLCGDGEAKNTIKILSEKDNRIKYLGQISHNEVLSLQKKASLLINPRRASEVFSKYSFPSKTLEYLASGTPLVMYKLDSLPSEYFEYIYFPKDETIESLTEIIVNILNKKEDDQIQRNKRRNFILNQKSAFNQVSRLIEFSRHLYRYKYENFN